MNYYFFWNDLCTNPNDEGGRQVPLYETNEDTIEGKTRTRWNLSSSSQHIGSFVRDKRRYDQRETSQKEPIPRQSNHLTICTRWQFLENHRSEEQKQGKQKMTIEKWEFSFYP